MREEIRQGNEALARHDLETAKRCFQQLLTKGGTPVQERIASNRLREIQEKQEGPRTPPTKRRARRKTTRAKATPEEAPKRSFVRPPDTPLVVIRKH